MRRVLDSESVREALTEAWRDSLPETDSAHEEGGFILRRLDGSLMVERWPRGAQDEIYVPEHPGCRRAGLPIAATFHTHPNSAPEFEQEPSPDDRRAVRADADLKDPQYEGEYVIARDVIFQILPDGSVAVVGDTRLLLPVT